jgi:hypothetical protein
VSVKAVDAPEVTDAVEGLICPPVPADADTEIGGGGLLPPPPPPPQDARNTAIKQLLRDLEVEVIIAPRDSQQIIVASNLEKSTNSITYFARILPI